MEFRNNIILSVVAHLSIAITLFALAGGKTVLSHLPPADYIVVSLFAYEDLKVPVTADRTKATNQNDSAYHPESGQFPPLEGDRHHVVRPRENKSAPQQRQEDGSIRGEKTVEEGLYPGRDVMQSVSRNEIFPTHTQGRTEESQTAQGDVRPAAHPSGALGTLDGDMELTIPSSGPAGPEVALRSTIELIKESIERAKMYPLVARIRGQEGTVVTEFSIDRQGRPENIRILRSSGFTILDRAARDTIVRAAPFPVVKGDLKVSIRFIRQ